MLSARQNFLETIHGGTPERFVNQWEAYEIIMTPPVWAAISGLMPGEADRQDSFGVWWTWPEDQPGAYPVHTPDKVVIKDIERWREQVKAPTLEYSDEEWAPCMEQARAVDRSEKYVCPVLAPGLFERCHHLMGITDCLMAFYENPDEMHELIEWITDYELALAEQICNRLQPDAMLHHDDWGSYESTFMSPEMFREFFFEPYKKIYGYYRSRGVELIVHHSDSYAATLVPSMIEMGIDVWQGAMLSNDIPALIEQYGGKISIQGGLENSRIDTPDWSREKIDEPVEQVCRECGALYFIPSLCGGTSESVIPPVYDEATKSIAAFSKQEFAQILEQSRMR